MLRRDQIGPDTFAKSATGSSIVINSRGGGSDSTPIERALLSKYHSKGDGPDVERHIRDPFRDDLREMERWVFELESLSTKIVERQKYLFYAEEKKKKEMSSAPCEANCPLPASKSGFCEEHFVEWRAIGCDRQRFVMYCQETRNSEGLLLVTNL